MYSPALPAAPSRGPHGPWRRTVRDPQIRSMSLSASLRLTRLPLVAGLALLASQSVSAAAPQALQRLFVPPSPDELQDVRSDWASRTVDVAGFQLEATGLGSSNEDVHIISHLSEGERHYVAVRFPQNYEPGQPHAAVVLCHGGLNGVSAEEAGNLLSTFPGQCIDDDYFILIPSFRGETLVSNFAGPFVSGGEPSYADRDVDDVMSMLSTLLVAYPDIDDARIAAWGISRGGATALLLKARDPRIRRVVDLFGFTDLSLPSVQAEVNEILFNGAPPAGIGRVMYEAAVEPWLSGAMTLEEARLSWIRRSPGYFVEDLAPIQVHHGLQDLSVEPAHSILLLDSLAALNLPAGDVEGYLYPNGSHGLNSLIGQGPRVEEFLCNLQLGPSGYCGPMSASASGGIASADYRGSASIGRNDLRFVVNHCPPGSAGMVFMAPRPAYFPSGGGFVCVGTGAIRIGFGSIDQAGRFELPVDLQTANPALTSFLNVGSSAYLQLVYRDLGNPNGFWNFSNGLVVPLLP